MYQTTSDQFSIDNDLHASQGQRFANFIIDYICQIILMMGITFVFVIIMVLLGNEGIVARIESMNKIEEYGIGILISLVYYNIFEIFTARTIGKFITNTVVVNEYGEKPTANEILIRSLCRLIPFDAFSFLGAPGKGWHDSISKTYVVKRDLLKEKKKAFTSLDQIGKTDDEL